MKRIYLKHGEQVKLAKNLGIHQVYLSSVFNGHRRPSPDLARRIEQATGGQVTRMELLYPEEAPRAEEA